MCGIFAYFSVRELSNSDINRIVKMSEKIKHRGPDDSRTISILNNKLILIFYRLSIVDLSKSAMQPFQTERYSAICNGEIYNYISLKSTYDIITKTSCDTEILPNLLDKVGIYKLCESIDGVFSFVIADNDSGLVHIARDPFGIRSLYFGDDVNGNYIVSSEMKAIPNSFYVQAFPPGHYANIEFANNRWNLKASIPYYNYNYKTIDEKNSENIQKK